MGAIAQFKKLFLATTQAKIHIISYLCVIIVSIMASMVVGSVQLFVTSLSMIIPMFFSSYAINCYVVGSCHGLSWFSTLLTLLWTSIFFLKLFVGGLVV
jgi:hypothetical protein